MECVACGMIKIGPKIPPFGGHLCDKGHLQCDECNTTKKGLCRICKGLNVFIQMRLGNNFGNENTPCTSRAAASSNGGKPIPSFKDKIGYEEDSEEDLSDVCSNACIKTTKHCSSGSSSDNLINFDEDALAQQMNDIYIYKDKRSCGKMHSDKKSLFCATLRDFQRQTSTNYYDPDEFPHFSAQAVATCGEPQARSQVLVQDLPEAPHVEPLKGTLLKQQSIDVECKSSPDVEPRLASTHNMKPFDMRLIYSEKFMTKLSNVHRVCLDPEYQGLHSSAPQIQTVPCHTDLVPELLQAKQHYINKPPMTANSLQISRAPIMCPVSSCQHLTFVSDYVKHMESDHSKVPIEYIIPGVYKNFSFSPKLSNVGASECQMVCLVHNKVMNLGSSKFKNFLPIAVMSSRISLQNFLNALEGTHATSMEQGAADEEVLVIWLTGILPEEFPVSIALTALSNAGADPPIKKMSSFDVISIRESQSVIDIVQTENNLTIYPGELQALTDGGKEMLDLQLMFLDFTNFTDMLQNSHQPSFK